MSVRARRGLRIRTIASAIAGFAAVLLLWHGLSAWADLSSVLLPPPADVVSDGALVLADGTLAADVLASIERVGVGFAVSAVAGLVLGLLLGGSPVLSAVFHPVLEALRPIPPIAWIPLAILWFGIGDAPSYFIVGVAAFFPTFVNTFTGIRAVDRRYIDVARTLGATPRMILLEVVLPAALPFMLTGLRVGLGIAWMAVVAAELVAARSGLGYMIQLNRSLLETSRVMVGMVTIGLIGYAMAAVLERLQRRLTPWRQEWEGTWRGG